MNRGEYFLYASSLSVKSALRTREVLYDAPVLSYVLESLMGRNSEYQAPEKWRTVQPTT